jgi:hypothetical protein
MNLIKLFKEDINISDEEIKKNLYDWHFYGGIVVTTILTILFYKFGGMPHIQPYIISIALNFLIWFGKEMLWFTAYTFEYRFKWLTKLRKYKVFQWGNPDWRDMRYSVYGSIPFIMILRLFKNK